MERTVRVTYVTAESIRRIRNDDTIPFDQKVKEYLKFKKLYTEIEDLNEEYEFYFVYYGPLR